MVYNYERWRWLSVHLSVAHRLKTDSVHPKGADFREYSPKLVKTR